MGKVKGVGRPRTKDERDARETDIYLGRVAPEPGDMFEAFLATRGREASAAETQRLERVVVDVPGQGPTVETAAARLEHPCGHCGLREGAGAAGLCLECNDLADAQGENDPPDEHLTRDFMLGWRVVAAYIAQFQNPHALEAGVGERRVRRFVQKEARSEQAGAMILGGFVTPDSNDDSSDYMRGLRAGASGRRCGS